jgi:hypothetical protein
MNAKQIKVIETVTSKQWLEWKFSTRFDGDMEFTFQQIGDKVFVHGSNAESIKWFQKHVMVQMLIGIKGGVSKLKVIH